MNKYIAFALIALFFSCNNEQENLTIHSKIDKSSSTQSMIDSINYIISQTDFSDHIYESGERAKILGTQVDKAIASNSLSPNLYIQYAKALLNAGQTEKSLTIFDEILKRLPQNRAINAQTKSLHEAIAIAYLRLGEQKNCIKNHSNESCLFPIKGKGIHTDKEGSQSAIRKYLDILQVFPDDLRSIWLLNLANMTIGEYPNNVPKQFLLPPNLFKSEYPIEEFENISTSLNIDITDLAGGVILDDFNNDGWIDIVASSWGMFGNVKILYSDKKGGYIDHTKESGLDGLVGGLNLIQGDYNNDGLLDFYIIRGAWRGLDKMGQLPNSLIKNNGDGTYTDVTIESGIYNACPTQSAMWVDFNTDGHLDLFVGNETHTDAEVHPVEFYLNNGDGTFEDVAKDIGIEFSAYVKGVAVGDVNNDNLPDIYISVISGPNKLFKNNGGSNKSDWSFSEIAQTWGVKEPLESFPTWFFDYNNDGFDDIFVSSFDKYSLFQQSREVAADYLGVESNSDFPRLYLNIDGERFENMTNALGLDRILPTMGCNFGDLDNDGWLDFYLGTGAPDYRAVVPNRMFRNNQGKGFQDVTYSGNFGHIQKGHGIGFADLDRDGDQDIYAVMGGSVSGDVSQNVLFENPGTNNNWINISLEGTKSNKSAIGAKIKLQVLRPDGSSYDIYNTVNSGGSFGANSLSQEIGLGEGGAIENLFVNWPNGDNIFVEFGKVDINRFLKITEDNSIINYLDFASIPFRKEEHQHNHNHH